MIVYQDVQGSEEWLAARRGVITASRFGDCRDRLAKGGLSKMCLAYAMDVARERVGGMAPVKFQSAPMRIGLEQEPQARIALEIERGYVVSEAGFVTTDDARFGVSVDGLVDSDGVVEIKTMVSSETLFRAIVAGDISEYMDQCNGAMWLLGRKWVDLVLWAPDLPTGQLTVVRIERNDDMINAMEQDLLAFDAIVTDYQYALHAKVAGDIARADKSPEPAKPETGKPEKIDKPDHALSRWAALRCKDPCFWGWIATQVGSPIEIEWFNESYAAAFVRQTCGVASRAEFDTDQAAAERFHQRIRGPYAAYCVKLDTDQ